ncbi:molybdenum cofactor guanylyltransferase [soil metagenome]
MRYGSPKALELVGGTRVVDRVAAALHDALDDEIVAIVNDAQLADAIGMPWRADTLEGAGALAGVHAALLWAVERDRRGAFVAGCDMPLIDAALVREIVSRRADADIIIPESEGPRGLEPLCAWYATACIPAIEAAVARGDRRMIGFHDAVSVERVGLDVVRTFGEPSRIFLNLNTPADRAVAERWLESGS